jgi:hypothetical protein
MPALEIEPASIVIGANAAGPIRRRIAINSRSPARITAIRSRFPCEHGSEISTVHSVEVLIPEGVSGRPDIRIDLELNPETGERECRTVTIPVFRLPANG